MITGMNEDFILTQNYNDLEHIKSACKTIGVPINYIHTKNLGTSGKYTRIYLQNNESPYKLFAIGRIVEIEIRHKKIEDSIDTNK